jgi:hypothetical protein
MYKASSKVKLLPYMRHQHIQVDVLLMPLIDSKMITAKHHCHLAFGVGLSPSTAHESNSIYNGQYAIDLYGPIRRTL